MSREILAFIDCPACTIDPNWCFNYSTANHHIYDMLIERNAQVKAIVNQNCGGAGPVIDLILRVGDIVRAIST